jgi:hypothetical protein
MRFLKQAALAATFAMLLPLAALAGSKNEHSVTIADPVTIGTSHLKPGHYKVEWQGSGPQVQVNFMDRGRTVATVPATLHTNDKKANEDEVVIDHKSPQATTLKEIDFHHEKEALVFGRSGM